MNIKSLINKVIASKGILRVPSWWMKKLLTEIVGYIDSGDGANAKSIDKAKSYADGKITNLKSEIKFDLLNLKKSLHTQKCFVVKTGASASYVVVDGVTQDIPANTQKIITFTDTFRFSIDSGIRYQPIEFIGLAVTDVSTMTSMERMFSNCEKLTSIDLSGLDASAVTNMNYMFSGCKSLKSIDLSGINASSVTTMRSMFTNCEKLTSIDLSGFKSLSVTDMNYMFSECKSLKSIDLSGFNTSKVTNMSYMFSGCGVTSLDVSNFDTSKVTNMSYMFSGCENLDSIDLSRFNTSAVTNMSYMFAGYEYDGTEHISGFTSLDLSNFDTSKVTTMMGMFGYCRRLKSLNLSNFDTSNVTEMWGMFTGCGITSIDLSNFDTSKVTTMNWMFSYCQNLTSLDLSNLDTSALTTIEGMFYNCRRLAYIDLSSIDTSLKTPSMYNSFYGCQNLTSLILSPNFFKGKSFSKVDFSPLIQWTNDTVVTSLVTNSYDRATAGLNTLTLQLSANTKAALTDEQKATITAKGYTIA